jgi:hypothetical protein
MKPGKAKLLCEGLQAMKSSSKLIIFIFTFLALTASAYAQSPREQLNQMVQQLQKSPGDNALREKIIKLAKSIKPAPAISEEANRAFVKGNVFQKDAKDSSGYELAIAAYREALRSAPWWGDAYFNLAVALESAGKFDEAIFSLRNYMASVAAGSAEHRDAQNKIYALEAKGEMAAKAKQDMQIVPGQRIGRITVGMAHGQLRQILGEPSETNNIGSWWRNYSWSTGLRVSIKMSLDTVDSVQVSGPAKQYRTAEGLAVGSSESEIRSRLGVPDRSGRIKYEGGNLYCYRSGLRFITRDGQVTFIEVFRPSGFDETYCEARFFE